MKQIVISLVMLLILTNCQENKTVRQEKTVEDHINIELAKNIKNETIFLGLKFGMGGEEVHNYFKDLVNHKKLLLLPHEYLSDKGKIYIYPFEFGNENPALQNVLGTFKIYYIKDKLYKLRISAESEKDTPVNLLKSKFKEVYIQKYGENYITRESIYNNSEVYVWINGNTMIEISEGLSNNILIIYSDLIALKDSQEKPAEKLMREI